MTVRRKLNRSAVKSNRENSKKTGINFETYLKKPAGIDFFDNKRKRAKFNIIPYVVTKENHPDDVPVGELAIGRQVFVHNKIGEDEKQVLCPKTFGKSCPICNDLSALWKDAETDEEKNAIKPKFAKTRMIYVVQEEDEDTVNLWDVSPHCFTKSLNEEIDEDDQFENYACPDGGFLLSVRFTEEELGTTKYWTTSRIDFEEREEPISDEILEMAPKIDDLLVLKTKAQLEAIHFGLDEETEEEEEEKPKKEKKTIKKREKVQEPDEDEVEEKPAKKSKKDKEEEAEEEEEEEKPAKKSKKDKEEEAEEEGEAEDEVEEKPAKKSKKDKEVSDNTCPHGHKFGDDYDEYEECDDCPNADSCMALFSEMPF